MKKNKFKSRTIKKKSKVTRSKQKPVAQKINQLSPVLVDVYFLAKHFGKTEKTIQNWAKKWRSEGMKPTEKRGTYNLVDCLIWRCRDLETDMAIRTKGDETDVQIRKDLLAIKRDTAAHELGMKRGEFIKVTDAKYIFSHACVLVNKFFTNLASTNAVRIAALSSPEAIESYLNAEITKGLLNASELHKQAESFAQRYSDNLAGIELSGTEAQPHN